MLQDWYAHCRGPLAAPPWSPPTLGETGPPARPHERVHAGKLPAGRAWALVHARGCQQGCAGLTHGALLLLLRQPALQIAAAAAAAAQEPGRCVSCCTVPCSCLLAGRHGADVLLPPHSLGTRADAQPQGPASENKREPPSLSKPVGKQATVRSRQSRTSSAAVWGRAGGGGGGGGGADSRTQSSTRSLSHGQAPCRRDYCTGPAAATFCAIRAWAICTASAVPLMVTLRSRVPGK